MTTLANEPIYCSDLSLQAEELLYGTAAQTQGYLLLEYAGAWGEKALEESDIPEQVKTRLSELGAQIRALKTLLIKTRRPPYQEAELRFFVVALAQNPPRLYAFRLAHYSDLLELDIPAIIAGEAAYAEYLQELPLYLICANGRRDRCCARHGLPVFDAIAAATQSSREPQVWQCTHVGGHRFAANLLCLPHGVLYGRVRAGDALAILEADRSGRIYLPNLRGRVIDPAAVQAAEFYLRQQQAEDRLDVYRPLDAIEAGPGEWVVRFKSQHADEILAVQVRVIVTEKRTFESCTQGKSTAILKYEFRLVER